MSKTPEEQKEVEKKAHRAAMRKKRRAHLKPGGKSIAFDFTVDFFKGNK